MIRIPALQILKYQYLYNVSRTRWCIVHTSMYQLNGACYKPVLLLHTEFSIKQIPSLSFLRNYANSSRLKPNLIQNYEKKNEKLTYSNPQNHHSFNELEKKDLSKSLSSQTSQTETSRVTKAQETLVHRYSRVPSLPSSLPPLRVRIPAEPSSDEVPSPIQRYFLGWFSKYLEKFRQSLANEMPDTFHMFHTFTKGFKDFVIDFRDYMAVIMKISLPFYDLEDLTRRELELYFYMPGQMIQVFPVVAISSLPLAQNVVLPFAYIFPKHLLCYHFWDANQRLEFPLSGLKKRLFNARPVFRSLQTRIDEVEDKNLHKECLSVFHSLGSGVHPTIDQILNLKQLFSGEPYHLNLLFAQHVNGLLRLHGRSAIFGRRKRLREHARFLHCMDEAVAKEGIYNLNKEQLRNMMLLRGINPSRLSGVDMIETLENWLYISNELSENSYSLLLHLPIFLAYNHPQNLQLINS